MLLNFKTRARIKAKFRTFHPRITSGKDRRNICRTRPNQTVESESDILLTGSRSARLNYRVSIRSNSMWRFFLYFSNECKFLHKILTTLLNNKMQAYMHFTANFCWDTSESDKVLFKPRPHFSAFQPPVVCCWLWKELVCWWWGCRPRLRHGKSYCRCSKWPPLANTHHLLSLALSCLNWFKIHISFSEMIKF